MNLAEKIGDLSSVGSHRDGLRGYDAAPTRRFKRKWKDYCCSRLRYDICYHGEQTLFKATGEEGLSSPNMPGRRTLPYHFPERNRIIAGLSKVSCYWGIQKSGSLIRRLGLSTERSHGRARSVSGEYRCQRVDKTGAKLVENINDILWLLSRLWAEAKEP